MAHGAIQGSIHLFKPAARRPPPAAVVPSPLSSHQPLRPRPLLLVSRRSHLAPRREGTGGGHPNRCGGALARRSCVCKAGHDEVVEVGTVDAVVDDLGGRVIADHAYRYHARRPEPLHASPPRCTR